MNLFGTGGSVRRVAVGSSAFSAFSIVATQSPQLISGTWNFMRDTFVYWRSDTDSSGGRSTEEIAAKKLHLTS